MGLARQLRLLLWKNFALRRRQPIRLVIELVWPLFLFLILVAVKKTRPDLDKKIPECHYDGKAMPSAGPLPFFQGLVCTFTNKCHQTVTADEQPGMVDTWNTSLLSEFFYDIESFLADQNEIGALVDLLDDLDYLYKLRENPPQNCTFTLGSVLIDPQVLRDSIISQNISLSLPAIDELLNASLSFSMVNITQFLQFASELQGNFTSAQNVTDVVRQIHGMVCTDDRTKEILWLDTWTLTQQLTSQLCNLTYIQFQEVIQDVAADLDWMKLYTQLTQCSGRELKYLNNDNLHPDRIQKVLTAFSDIESLDRVMKQFNSTFYEALEDYQSDINGSALALISQIFCSRNSTFLAEDEGALEKEVREQMEEHEDGKEEEEENEEAKKKKVPTATLR